MNEGIIITPNNIVIRIWDEEKKKHRRKTIKPRDLPSHLWDVVEIEGNVSLGRLFSIVEEAQEVWEALLCENITPFIEESRKPTTKQTGDMEYLEVYWDAETTTFEGKKDFEIWASFNGAGHASKDDEISKKGDQIFFGVEFTPINNLVQYPVRLNKKVEMVITNLDGTKPESETMDLGDKHFSVLELFEAIFFELTFLGTPEARDEEMGMIKERMKEVQEGVADGLPWEDVKERIKKNAEKKDAEKRDSLGLLDEGI